MSVLTIQPILRHKKPAATELYVKAINRHVEDVLELVGENVPNGVSESAKYWQFKGFRTPVSAVKGRLTTLFLSMINGAQAFVS